MAADVDGDGRVDEVCDLCLCYLCVLSAAVANSPLAISLAGLKKKGAAHCTGGVCTAQTQADGRRERRGHHSLSAAFLSSSE